MNRLRRAIRYFILAIRGEPVRSWRKLDNGKYMCDSDCGRWKLHGVCTCGICHLLKIEENGHDRIERGNVSWTRESDTESHMMHVPYREHCEHGRHLNEPGLCPICQEQFYSFLKTFNNEDHSITS